jgi:hypothetical protein
MSGCAPHPRRHRRHRSVRRVAGSFVAAAAVLSQWVTPVGAAEPFRNGEAEASASTFSVNVVQGNANIGFVYGTTLANYRDTTGTAEAKALDLGVFPTLFGVEQCDGSAPILNPASFPPQTRTDSTDPSSATPRPATAFLPGFGTQRPAARAGEQDATATKLPSSRATTTSANADLFVLALDGGQTEVRTQLRDGVREAVAVTTARQLRVLGGLFTFVNPRWEATARSGATTTAQGAFTFDRATVLGAPRSAEQVMADFEGFRRGLEELLAPLGVELTLPEVIVDGGRVTVTPMRFAVRDMPIGAQVLAPFLGGLQPLRDALTKQLLEEDCRNESSLLVLDILLGVLSGSGALEIDAGGVEVFTADTDFSSPPLELPPVDVPAGPVVEVADGSLDAGAPLDLGTFDPGPIDTLGNLPATTFDTPLPEATPVTTPATTVPTERNQEQATTATLVPSTFEDSDNGAAAATVGLAGLLAAIGLSMGERWKLRRNHRRIP